MKKLALLSLAVSQGQAIHNSNKSKSKSKKQYLVEMNKLLSKSKKNTSQYKKAINVLKKFKSRYTKRSQSKVKN